MELHFETSEGSGFDVACARAGGAIAYQKTGPRSAVWSNVASAHWPHEHFGLVYLGGKQDSQREVAKIRSEPLASELDAISALSRHLASSSNAEAWMQGIDELEDRTASWLGMERVQKRFPGVRATIKSLGAWGGDFALAVAQDPEDLAYFSLNGHLFLKWSDCVSLPS
jgi:mevalonate kinase